ncbi:MAG: TetR/AcrR family transcriptional regulator C-terminal domain-containing protein [Acidimicrobiia bacterium]|nr:TetR/AcrR family transcriptional regulator C-terminal domain-containing protein [Acidimicrobiia bacterium]
MAVTDRATLSRELIARTALELIDNDGLDGLSMRKLGSALGVEAMSLYHYIDNKEDLLNAIVDNLYGEIELPSDIPGDDWERAFRLALHSFHDVLLRHPASLELFTTRQASSGNALTVMSWAFDRCRLAGLDPEQAANTFHFCVAFVLGHAATELGMMSRIETNEEITLPAGGGMSPGFQAFLDHIAASGNAKVFEFGLEMLFASLSSTFGLSRS